MYAWLMFLYSHCITDAVLPANALPRKCRLAERTSQAGCLHILPCVISVLCPPGHLRNTVITSPGLVAMVTKHWIKEGAGQRQQNWALALSTNDDSKPRA